MITSQQHQTVVGDIQRAAETITGRDALLHTVMAIIARDLPHYRWVGVYLLDNGVLNLGPFVGAATEHTLIRVGQGVCGTAVAENRNIIVDDVRGLTNYLACSVGTRSEIVVLIRDGESGQILGQIDADGDTVGAFDATDEAFLTDVAALLAPRLWKAE